MGYKMKGAPMYDTSSKHGTNKNYQMSGMTKDGAPFLGGIGKAIGRGLKGAAKFGAFGPLGNIASALIDKNKAKLTRCMLYVSIFPNHHHIICLIKVGGDL